MQPTSVVAVNAGARSRLEIELIQPLEGNTDYAAFLERNGGNAGVHHIRVDFDDIEEVHATGKKMLLSGVPKGSGMAYEYYDFRDELGLVLEYFPVQR